MGALTFTLTHPEAIGTTGIDGSWDCDHDCDAFGQVDAMQPARCTECQPSKWFDVQQVKYTPGLPEQHCVDPEWVVALTIGLPSALLALCVSSIVLVLMRRARQR